MRSSHRASTWTILLGSLTGLLAEGSLEAGEIEVIYSEVPGDPTAQVPGAKDLNGDPISTEFKAIEDLNMSADGTEWIIRARNTAGADLETMLLLGSGTSGSVLAQEGQPVAGGVEGEVYDFFDAVAGFNDSGQYAYGARARGGESSVKEKVIKFDGNDFTIVVQESDPAMGLLDLPPNPSGDELFGNSLNSIHLLNDGRVGFVAVTIQNVSSFRRPALFYDDDAFAQSGVTPIDGSVWDSFDSDTFFTTPDGNHWIAEGDDESGGIGAPDLLAVDGAVALINGGAVDGIVVEDIFNAKLLSNGDWFARGDDAADDDWAVRNGSLLAATGMPITSGSGESWGDSFPSFTGNRVGDWVLAGNTNAADPATDSVIVLNGEEVVVREGDPVDLDGNGQFDDDVFIGRGDSDLSAFNPNDIFLTDDRVLYFFAPLRNAAGEDLGESGGVGDAFLRLALADERCTGDTNADGVVNVTDLINVISDWGTDGSANGGNVDDTGSSQGIVDVSDLIAVITTWGECR